MTGFPSDISKVTWKNERVAFNAFDWSEITPPRGELKDFVPERHFLAEYSERLLEDESASPRGFSGSAYWYRQGPTPLVWHPNLEVGGIVTDHYRRPNLMLAVRRETLEAFLEKIAP
jgi:hypothetical protein